MADSDRRADRRLHDVRWGRGRHAHHARGCRPHHHHLGRGLRQGTLLGGSAGRQQGIISMAHDQIRLDDLLARDVSVQWFEGVALVQALCRQLSARSGADGVFPGPSQITLASDGTVTIGGAAATRAVPAAGHLLARMLSDDAPVRLRLLVTQATAEDATSGSLHEFSEVARLLRAAESRRHPQRAPRPSGCGASGAASGRGDR